jgi:hypothetical protein
MRKPKSKAGERERLGRGEVKLTVVEGNDVSLRPDEFIYN